MASDRPTEEEHAPYYDRYIKKVDGELIEEALIKNTDDVFAMINVIPEEKGNVRYSEGKWSVKEVLMHVIDTEWVFAYRGLRIARNDKTSLPGFEQDDFAKSYAVENRSLKSIVEEFKFLRIATKKLFRNLDDESLKRVGEASGNKLSPRAAAYILMGHSLHHLQIIHDRYL